MGIYVLPIEHKVIHLPPLDFSISHFESVRQAEFRQISKDAQKNKTPKIPILFRILGNNETTFEMGGFRLFLRKQVAFLRAVCTPKEQRNRSGAGVTADRGTDIIDFHPAVQLRETLFYKLCNCSR